MASQPALETVKMEFVLGGFSGAGLAALYAGLLVSCRTSLQCGAVSVQG